MSGHLRIRQMHRWLAATFTLTVIVGFVTWGFGYRAAWVGFLALAPLACLLVSGLYLLVAPHAARWRGGHRNRLA